MNDNLQQYENLIREASLRADESKVRSIQQEAMLSQQDSSMIKEQIDLTEELERMDYLLRGYNLERDAETGESKWVAPDNNDKIILSEYGVHLIRNTIAWYLNKNTLLSNYDEGTIMTKMEDFASDLNDTIFMEYEKAFQYPSFEDCKKALQERIDNRRNMQVYSLELLGRKIGEEERTKIEQSILKELEPTINKEFEKIRSQIMKNKLKRFMILIRVVQDAVHSTYLRALMGQERRTLREHITISETKGNVMMPESKGGFLSFLKGK